MVCRGEICAPNKGSKVRGQPDTHGPTTTSTCCLYISRAKSYEAELKYEACLGKLKDTLTTHTLTHLHKGHIDFVHIGPLLSVQFDADKVVT